MGKDIMEYIYFCLQCTIAENRQPGRQAPLEVIHLERRFEQVAFDAQTIKPRTFRDDIKVLSMVGIFFLFVRTRAVCDEKAETIAQVLIDDCIALLGPMEWLLSD